MTINTTIINQESDALSELVVCTRDVSKTARLQAYLYEAIDTAVVVQTAVKAVDLIAYLNGSEDSNNNIDFIGFCQYKAKLKPLTKLDSVPDATHLLRTVAANLEEPLKGLFVKAASRLLKEAAAGNVAHLERVLIDENLSTERPKRRQLPALKPPLPELTSADIEAIKKRLHSKPWPGSGSPFEWVRDNFKKWIPGLLQCHLRSDTHPQLYNAFMKRVSREGLPDWLDVPSERDANLRKLSPKEQKKLLIVREVSAEKKRLQRASNG